MTRELYHQTADIHDEAMNLEKHIGMLKAYRFKICQRNDKGNNRYWIQRDDKVDDERVCEELSVMIQNWESYLLETFPDMVSHSCVKYRNIWMTADRRQEIYLMERKMQKEDAPILPQLRDLIFDRIALRDIQKRVMDINEMKPYLKDKCPGRLDVDCKALADCPDYHRLAVWRRKDDNDVEIGVHALEQVKVEREVVSKSIKVLLSCLLLHYCTDKYCTDKNCTDKYSAYKYSAYNYSAYKYCTGETQPYCLGHLTMGLSQACKIFQSIFSSKVCHVSLGFFPEVLLDLKQSETG